MSSMFSSSQSTYKKHDNSDRKSLEILVQRLIQAEPPRKPPASPSRTNCPSTPKRASSKMTNDKAKPPKKPCSESPIQRRMRQKKTQSQTTKITSWIQTPKDSHKEHETRAPEKENKAKKRSSKQSNPEPLDITVSKKNGDSPREMRDNSKKKTKLERSSSFEKYGVIIPSVEDILKDQKKYEEHKKIVDTFKELDDVKEIRFEDFDKEESFRGKVLDCKHLDRDEIAEGFRRHLTVLNRIKEGKKYSARHQRFHNFDVKYVHTTKDLSYNTSMIVFSQEQKDHMIDLMEESMDPEKKLLNYFFKVLLPELCLLIFMDVHGMGRREAESYLDARPID